MKNHLEPWKTHLKPWKATGWLRVVTGGYRRLQGRSEYFSRDTHKQTDTLSWYIYHHPIDLLIFFASYTALSYINNINASRPCTQTSTARISSKPQHQLQLQRQQQPLDDFLAQLKKYLPKCPQTPMVKLFPTPTTTTDTTSTHNTQHTTSLDTGVERGFSNTGVSDHFPLTTKLISFSVAVFFCFDN